MKKTWRECPERFYVSEMILKLFSTLFTLGSDPLSGDDGTRTRDIRLAKAALSQLSYIPRIVPQGSGPDWIRTNDPCVISTVL